MLLLSPQLFRLGKFCIQLAYFFQTIPFNWCEGCERVHRIQAPLWVFWRWAFLKYVIVLHELLLLIILGQYLMSDEKLDPSLASVYISDFLYLTCSFVVFNLEVAVMHHTDLIISFLNAYLSFCRKFEGRVNKYFCANCTTLIISLIRYFPKSIHCIFYKQNFN
jgi:hypothetical protein